MHPRVSAVIPCYNAERFVGEAIESALAQSRPPDEVVVVDDGSTDGSVRIAASFGAAVRIVPGPRAGVGAVRDAGLRAATGDLVALLDADDVWESDKLERQVPRFEDPSVGLVYCRTRRFGQRGCSDATWPIEMPEGEVFEQLYFQNFVACPSAAVVRREALIDTGGFDWSLRNSEDIDAWLRLALRWSFAAVPLALTRYRLHGGQLSALRADVVRYGLLVREKHASEFERRTGISSAERRERLARRYLTELSGMISKRDLRQARALAAVLDEAFASDGPDVRRAIAYKRRVAGSTRPALWLRQLLVKSRRVFAPAG